MLQDLGADRRESERVRERERERERMKEEGEEKWNKTGIIVRRVKAAKAFQSLIQFLTPGFLLFSSKEEKRQTRKSDKKIQAMSHFFSISNLP